MTTQRFPNKLIAGQAIAPARLGRWVGVSLAGLMALLLIIMSGGPASVLADGSGHTISIGTATQAADEGNTISFRINVSPADNNLYPCFSWSITHGTTDNDDFTTSPLNGVAYFEFAGSLCTLADKYQRGLGYRAK